MRFDQVVSTYGYPLISKEVAEAIHYARKISHPTKRNAETKFCRKDLIGNRDAELEMRLKQEGNKNELIETSNAKNRRTVLQGKMEKDGYHKSQFNKDKWLPIARDFPIMISHYCCFKMKKSPMKKYQHDNGYVPIIGTLAEESRVRRQAWIKHGCNAFDGKNPTSQPLSFWTEQDILTYIVENNLDIASVYGEIVSTDEYGNQCPPIDLTGKPGCNLKCTGCTRTGCIFCGFGFHLDKGETRFQRLARTHPKQYEYSISGGQWVDNPTYDPTAPKMDGEWQNWNPKKIWVPSKQGLGMGKVFDMVNEIYGKDFYRYE